MATPGILAIPAPGSFIDDVDPDGRGVAAQADLDRNGRPSPVGMLDRVRACLVAREHHLFACLIRERHLHEPPPDRGTNVGERARFGGHRDDEWRSLRRRAQAEDGHVVVLGTLTDQQSEESIGEVLRVS